MVRKIGGDTGIAGTGSCGALSLLVHFSRNTHTFVESLRSLTTVAQMVSNVSLTMIEHRKSKTPRSEQAFSATIIASACVAGLATSK